MGSLGKEGIQASGKERVDNPCRLTEAEGPVHKASQSPWVPKGGGEG